MSSEGVWRVSNHASEALFHRWNGFPLLAPFFHGWGWGAALALTGPVRAKPVAVWRLLVANFLVCVLFLIPIQATAVPLMRLLDPFLAVPLTIILFAVPLILLPPRPCSAGSCC